MQIFQFDCIRDSPFVTLDCCGRVSCCTKSGLNVICIPSYSNISILSAADTAATDAYWTLASPWNPLVYTSTGHHPVCTWGFHTYGHSHKWGDENLMKCYLLAILHLSIAMFYTFLLSFEFLGAIRCMLSLLEEPSLCWAGSRTEFLWTVSWWGPFLCM